MESFEPLEDLLIDSEDLIRRCLQALGEGEILGGAVIGEIELRYRLIGIARLLTEGDPDAFRGSLHRSGCAALYLFELLEQGIEFLDVARVTELSNQVGGTNQAWHIIGFLVFRAIRDREASTLNAGLDQFQV